MFKVLGKFQYFIWLYNIRSFFHAGKIYNGGIQKNTVIRET